MTMKIDWMRGCATALVTPFKSDGAIDEECLRELVDRQITGGVKLLVPCGTTGESATMTEDEDARVIALTIEVARGRAKVIAGAGRTRPPRQSSIQSARRNSAPTRSCKSLPGTTNQHRKVCTRTSMRLRTRFPICRSCFTTCRVALRRTSQRRQHCVWRVTAKTSWRLKKRPETFRR